MAASVPSFGTPPGEGPGRRRAAEERVGSQPSGQAGSSADLEPACLPACLPACIGRYRPLKTKCSIAFGANVGIQASRRGVHSARLSRSTAPPWLTHRDACLLGTSPGRWYNNNRPLQGGPQPRSGDPTGPDSFVGGMLLATGDAPASLADPLPVLGARFGRVRICAGAPVMLPCCGQGPPVSSYEPYVRADFTRGLQGGLTR
jgi:hypothetical protein